MAEHAMEPTYGHSTAVFPMWNGYMYEPKAKCIISEDLLESSDSSGDESRDYEYIVVNNITLETDDMGYPIVQQSGE